MRELAGDTSMTAVKKALTFYRFTNVADVQTCQAELLQLGQVEDLRGTILVANEGVNGTLVGSLSGLERMREKLILLFGDMPFKWSDIAPENDGFFRFKVKLKEEIVTFGVPTIDVEQTGTHVDVERWNQLLADPNVVVVDTRNQYEIDIGTFPGSISPETTNFREFPDWVAENLDPKSNQQVAMFCTGGIRCEKASSYLKQQGFDEVYQLDGGILKYLENVAAEENRWDGECFVFDQRVSVTAALEQGNFSQCFACRHPVSQEDMASPSYVEGVSCPHCIDQEISRERFVERQKQIGLAAKRGEAHLGPKDT